MKPPGRFLENPRISRGHARANLPCSGVAVDRLTFTTDRLTFAIDRLTFTTDRLTFTIDRLTFTIDRLTFTIDRLTFTIDHLTFTIDRLTFAIDRLTFTIDRLTFTIDRLTFTIDRLTFTIDWVGVMLPDRGGPSGTRTRMPFRAADFKSAAYTDSAKGPDWVILSHGTAGEGSLQPRRTSPEL